MITRPSGCFAYTTDSDAQITERHDVELCQSPLYGTMGALLAVVFSAYLVALALIFGAHVSAAAGRPEQLGALPGGGISESLRGPFVRRAKASPPPRPDGS